MRSLARTHCGPARFTIGVHAITLLLEMQRPAPQDFSDYRTYLRQMVAYLKASTKTFSYRAFAMRSGFSSVGFLKHLIEGERNLAAKSVPKVARGLGLSEQEERAFELLVGLSEASNDQERTRLLRRLRASSLKRRIHGDAFELYSTPHAVPLRELLTLEDAPSQPMELGKRLWPRARAAEVKRALGTLQELGLLEVDEAGRLRGVSGALETDAEVQSLAVRNYHRTMLQCAAASLDALPRAERSVTSVTVKLTRCQYERVCKQIDSFQDALLSALGGDEQPSSASELEVYHLSFALVPATRRTQQ